MTPTLLVIDDNVSVREALRFLLLSRGYNVHTADGGSQALRLLQEHSIDGVIVDVQMPAMNGFEVSRALREQAAASGRRLAIWMMSGGRSAELMRQAAEAGALALVSKPFDCADLFRRLDEQFGPLEPVRDSTLT